MTKDKSERLLAKYTDAEFNKVEDGGFVKTLLSSVERQHCTNKIIYITDCKLVLNTDLILDW